MGGLYIWYSEEGPGRAAAPPSPLLAVPNVTTHHPSTASVPITVLLYDGPLLCGFNVAIKGLIFLSASLCILMPQQAEANEFSLCLSRCPDVWCQHVFVRITTLSNAMFLCYKKHVEHDDSVPAI